ncbi:Mu transposase C-terminal domain-containing protein [Streptomyces cyaneofuscatus]|uniref:Mu transposase C-terminal domain-containing protein n=1 Tax=Streptomyces cyaneofuscatus TaxID=66883 RepID=UPI0036C6066B
MTPAPEPARDIELRRGIVNHLLNLRRDGQLTTDAKRTVAASQGCTLRTIDNWIRNADQHNGVYTPAPRPRAHLTLHMRAELARWLGNRKSAYRQLRKDGKIKVSYATFTRMVDRDLAAGHLESFKGGTAALRDFELRNSRERSNRNDAWEADNLDTKVFVRMGSKIIRPQITHFDDAATDAICGMAVTPHAPSSDAVLAALRDAILRDEEHGPFGGVPTLIRVDRGSEFCGEAAGQAMGAFSITRVILPPRTPWRKGTVETINHALTSTLLSGMPGYSPRPQPNGKITYRPGPIEDLYTWEEFVTEVLQWRDAWNTEHVITELGNRTPLQAWQDDLTPLRDIPRKALHRYTLREDKRLHTIQPSGIRWGNADYYTTENWLRERVGDPVRLRYMPHHRRTIQVYHATDNTYLGEAYLKSEATPEQKREVLRGNRRVADRAKRDRTRALRNLRERRAATTTAEPAQPLNSLTQQEAEKELDRLGIRPPDRTPRNLPNPTISWGTTPPTRHPHSAPPAPHLPAPTSSWDTDPTPPATTPQTPPPDEDSQPPALETP